MWIMEIRKETTIKWVMYCLGFRCLLRSGLEAHSCGTQGFFLGSRILLALLMNRLRHVRVDPDMSYSPNS